MDMRTRGTHMGMIIRHNAVGIKSDRNIVSERKTMTPPLRSYRINLSSCELIPSYRNITRQDMMESNATYKYRVIPLHHRPDLIKDCYKLLNSEWPRSETARTKSLKVSCDEFPTSLILINDKDKVLGHCKISLVGRLKISCYIESVVIDYRYRSQGLGSRLLRDMEEYVVRKGLRNIYLRTVGQEVFYYKNGYKVCDPFKAYGINDIITASPPLDKTKFKERNADQAGQPPPPPPPPMPALHLSKFFDTRMLSQKTHMITILS
ncbi:N-alpha-acetyltransferase 80 isoform X2 [Cataglyphis hispanica]|uniref:N-alpha-acetyltransferase 80 isoform X2 n=1 Tax=Cataglyphis hispanica TaxID=1086592 RepID=UPI0021803FD2|nr:N-alpha-acetyltransferase 80 isoform X2 [Cataglyphis hispanica]